MIILTFAFILRPYKNDSPKRSFTISSSSLKSKYKHLMKDVPPDRHDAALSQDEKSQKALQATNVTQAYSVLNNPLSRALHLLDLRGASINESNNVSWIMNRPSCSFLFVRLLTNGVRLRVRPSTSPVYHRPRLPPPNYGNAWSNRTSLHRWTT